MIAMVGLTPRAPSRLGSSSQDWRHPELFSGHILNISRLCKVLCFIHTRIHTSSVLARNLFVVCAVSICFLILTSLRYPSPHLGFILGSCIMSY